MAIKDKFKNVSKKMKKLSKEKTDELKEKVMEEPFAIIDVSFVVNFAQDPVGVLGELVTDPEFIGECIKTALDCVPVIGPILAGVFSIFWPSDPQKQPVTKQELDNRLKEFKEEMEKIMDDKISQSEAKIWKSLCGAFFDTLAYRCSELKDDLSLMKRHFKEDGETTDELKTDIRVALNEIRHQAKQLSNFCRDDKYVKNVVNYYIDCLFIMCAIYRQMDAYWYQYGIDPLYVSGAPEVKADGLDAIRSIKEKLHDNLFEGINHMTKGVIQNIKDGKPELNKDFNEKAAKLLKQDMQFYPCKLIEAKLNIPGRIELIHQVGSGGTPSITLPDIKGPFIYRVDGANFRPDEHAESHRSGRRTIPEADPLSGCKGTLTTYNPKLNIKLTKARSVSIRIFGQYSSNIENLQLNLDGVQIPEENKATPLLGLSGMGGIIQIPMGGQQCYKIPAVQYPLSLVKSDEVFDHDGVKSGFTQTVKFSNVTNLTLTLSHAPPPPPPPPPPPKDDDPFGGFGMRENIMYIDNSQGHIRFVEFIVSK